MQIGDAPVDTVDPYRIVVWCARPAETCRLWCQIDAILTPFWIAPGLMEPVYALRLLTGRLPVLPVNRTVDVGATL